MGQLKQFSCFLTKTFVVGTEKNCLDEKDPLSTQNKCLILCIRKNSHFCAQIICLSRPMPWHTFKGNIHTFRHVRRVAPSEYFNVANTLKA